MPLAVPILIFGAGTLTDAAGSAPKLLAASSLLLAAAPFAVGTTVPGHKLPAFPSKTAVSGIVNREEVSGKRNPPAAVSVIGGPAFPLLVPNREARKQRVTALGDLTERRHYRSMGGV